MTLHEGKIIAISNKKGGCGKTTTAIQLASGLIERNKKILLVEGDPQGTLTKHYCIHCSGKPTVKDFILDQTDARVTIHDHLDILPGDTSLNKVSNALLHEPDGPLYLSYALEQIKYDYDYVLIDCPPSDSLIANNCYAAADEVIIPVFPGIYSLDGMVLMKSQLDKIKRVFNPGLKVTGILILNVDTGTNAKKEIERLANECSNHLESHCFEAIIPHSTAVNDAQLQSMSLLEFKKSAKVTKAYEQFVDEFLEVLA